jgi:hypothetical protein
MTGCIRFLDRRAYPLSSLEAIRVQLVRCTICLSNDCSYMQSAIALRQFIHNSRMLPLRKPEPVTCVHLRTRGIAKGDFCVGPNRLLIHTCAGRAHSEALRLGAGRPSFSNLFDNGEARNLPRNSSLRPGADKAFGSRRILQPRIFVRPDVLAQKLQDLVDFRCQSVWTTVQSDKGDRRRGPIR